MSVLMNFDFAQVFSPMMLLTILFGSFVGMFIGALPGLGATIAIVMLLPLTYTMTPLAAILLILATYQAAEYGGSISSIILGIPGTPAAVATVLDGNALARAGQPGKALGYSLTASTIGGLVGGFVLIFLSFPLAGLAQNLADPEYCLIALIGLVVATGISAKDFVKSMISVCIGLLLSVVGTDMFTGAARFTFGLQVLADGIKMISILVGLFAVTEVLNIISTSLHKEDNSLSNSKGLKTSLSFKEVKSIGKAVTIGSVFGGFMGGIPGLGPVVATFLSYSTIKKVGNKTIPFGEGNPEGIAAPESANNAGVGGNLIPLLVFGIPNNATIALVMSAFIVHGIKPGPKIFTSEPALVSGILVGFLLTTLAMYVLGRLLTPLFARSLSVPNEVLMPIVLVVSLLGAYASATTYFAVGFAVAFGVIGYIIIKLDFSMTGMVLAFVLGPLLEESYRRTLLISGGTNRIFFERPYSLGILCIIFVVAVVVIGLKAVKYFKKKKAEA